MRYVIVSFHTNYFSEDPDMFHIFGFRLNASDGLIDSIKDVARDEGLFDDLSEDFENHLEHTFDFCTMGEEQVFGGSVYEMDESHLDHMRKSMEFLRDWFDYSACIPGEIIHTFGPYDKAEKEFESKL